MDLQVGYVELGVLALEFKVWVVGLRVLELASC